MSYKDEYEKRVVYAKANNANYRDEDQGFIKPIFEETADGLVPSDPETYINNGLIRVTKGYHFFSQEDENQFFRVETNISTTWSSDTAHDNISKFVTYDRISEVAQDLKISLIIDSEYPNPNKTEGIPCISNTYPVDSFFIRCFDMNNTHVIVGPFAAIKSTIQHNNNQYTFKYKTLDRHLGGSWAKLNTIPHSALVFDISLIPNNVIYSESNEDYIVNNTNLPFSSSSIIDLSSDENILKWASKLLRTSGQEDLKSKIPELKKLIDNIPEDSNLPKEIFETRKHRLGINPQILENLDGINQIISDYLRTSNGIGLIKGFVDANRDSLVEKYLSDEKEKKKIIFEKNLSSEISALNFKKNKLVESIREVEEKWSETRNSKKGMELEELGEEIAKLRSEKRNILNVDELLTQKKLISHEIEDLKKDRNNASSLLTEIQREINTSQEKHKIDLLKLKIGLDALSGNIRDISELKTNITIQDEYIPVQEISDKSRLQVIESITESLISQGRVITNDEVAILLTCILQNLIVTLAGKPGSGKSSTARCLANSLAIKNSGKYVHVQVQRGWSSDKDLLGFYNKLSISYDPDPHGLYKLINTLQDINIEDQFSIVLLDEANLSPIEHYWSGFMGACDDIDSFRVDNPNNKSPFQLPLGIKFIATVNYDRTTEPLSERFLDRSPVIYLEGIDSDLFGNDYINDNSDGVLLNYSFKDLDNLFGRKPDSKLKSDEERIIKEIKSDHNFLNIGYRKVILITNFTDRLRKVLDKDDADPLKAFDYAITIFILPMISGQGREYTKAIKNLYDFLSSQGLTRSSRRLESIISNSQFDSYSYFS